MELTQNKEKKDRIKYLNTFFINRGNGNVDEKMQEELNYDKETLEYITPGAVADRIRNRIIDIMSEVEISQFMMYDICGCIGGSAISFLSAEEIKYVFTYEMKIEWVNMLKRNINLYGLGHKSMVYPNKFTITSKISKGSVVFFDPPWLSGISGEDQINYDQYVLEGIKLGDNTLEDYLTKYGSEKSHYLVVFHVPPNYRLNPVNGWKYEVVHEYRFQTKIVKRTLYYCTHDESKYDSKRHKGGIYGVESLKGIEAYFTSNWVDPVTDSKQQVLNANVKPTNMKPSLSNLLNTPSRTQTGGLPPNRAQPSSPFPPNRTQPSSPFPPSRTQTGGLPPNKVRPSSPFPPSRTQTGGLPPNKVRPSSPFPSGGLPPSGPRTVNAPPSLKTLLNPTRKSPTRTQVGAKPPSLNTLLNPRRTNVNPTNFGLPPRKNISEVKEEVPVDTTVITGDFKKLIDSLPIYDNTIAPNSTQKDIMIKWVTHLRQYITVMLSSIISDDDIIIRMVDSPSMRIWSRAFTYKNFSSSENYETLETVGDGVLSYAFRKLLYKRFPLITSESINNFSTSYMAKIFQGKVAMEMGFHNIVRIQGKSRVSINEDLFESFFGALDTVGDSIQKGQGSTFCTMFLELIFKDRDFDARRGLSDAKTFVNQSSTRLHWDSNSVNGKGVIVTDTISNGNVEVEILLSNYVITYLKNVMGVTFENPIAKSVQKTKKGAETEAYEIVFNKLQEIGFDKNKTDSLRAGIELDGLESFNKELVLKAKAKAMTNYGSSDLRFIVDRSSVKIDQTQIRLEIYIDSENSKILEVATTTNNKYSNNNTNSKEIKERLSIETLKSFISK